MSGEGEFQKRIRKCFEEEIGFEIIGDMAGSIGDITKIVEEAKKEFPWHPPIVIKNCPLDVARAIQWFVKWFGSPTNKESSENE